jgi:iron complex outermembrane receptor protein
MARNSLQIHRTTNRAILVGLLTGITLVTTRTALVLADDQQQPPQQRTQPAQADATFPFDIPSKPLPQALNDFGRITGLTVLFTEEKPIEHTAPRLSGRLTAAQALNRLLAGSGYTYRFTDAKTVTLERVLTQPGEQRLQLAPTTVEDRALRIAETQVTAERERAYIVKEATTVTKTDTPIIDTPFSIQVVPQQVLEDQQALDLFDAIKNVSGVQPLRPVGVDRQSLTIRGFDSRGFIYRDGLRTPLFTTRFYQTPGIDRIEVLKGPASMLFGRTEPGGIVNLVTKKPLREYHHSIQQQVGSYNFYRTTVDSTGPIPGAENVQYRFIASYENADSFRDFVESDTTFISPQIAWDITDQTRVRVWLEYEDDERTQDQGLVAIGDRPADLPDDTFLGSPTDFIVNETLRTGLDLSHEFSEDWTFRGAFHYEDNERSDVRTRPADTDGDCVRLDETTGELEREFADNIGISETYFLTANIEGHFETGPLKHTVLFGVDYSRSDIDFQFAAFGGAPLFGQDTASINIFNPVHTVFAPDPRALPVNDTSNFTDQWVGLYWQDQIALFDDRLHILAGGRYDDAEADSGISPGTFSETNEVSKYTQRYGILYKPMDWLSVYGSYTESVSGEFVFNTRPGGETLDPETAQQWEIGAKGLFLNDRLSVSLTGFELTKQDIAVPDPLNPGFSVALGEAQSRGLELDVAGELAPGWNIIASYTWLEQAEITEDGTLGQEGNRLFNAPRHAGSFWLTYALPLHTPLRGLRLGAGVFAASEREGDNDNSFEAAGYARVDAMASYTWFMARMRWTAQVNIENLLDEEYFLNTGNSRLGGIRPGVPISVLASLRVEF